MNLKEKYAGMSFADVSKKISDKYKNRDSDAIQMRSFMQEMEDLKKLQEAYKTAKEVKDALTKVDLKGTTEVNNNLPKAFNGLDLTELVKDPELTTIGTNTQQLGLNLGLNQIPTLPTSPLNTQIISDKTTPNSSQYKGVTDLLPQRKLSESEVVQLNRTEPKLEAPKSADTKKKSKLEEFFENPNSAWKLSTAAEALGKGIMLGTGRETYNAITNPYQQEALDLIRNQRINSQAVKNEVLAQQEAALQNLANVRSTAVQQAGQQNIYSQTADQMARTELQEQGLRNQLSGQMASALTQLGGQQMTAEQQARQLNIASQQTQQQSIQNMIESIGATGQEISEFRQGIASNEFVFKLLATGNFEIDAKCMKDLQLGKSIETACIKSKASGKESPQDITNVNRNTNLASNTASTTNTKTTG